MVQIISISQARANLASLVKQVETTQQPVVIVQDSKPVVVLQPYVQNNEYEDNLPLQIKPQTFEELSGFLKGRKKFSEKTEKEVIEEAVVEKFLEKEAANKVEKGAAE